jgi:hypothetical protein
MLQLSTSQILRNWTFSVPFSGESCTERSPSQRQITGTSYLDNKQERLMPQFEDDRDDFIYQQDGAPPHYNNLVRGYFNQHLPQRWIRRTKADQALLRWPPRSRELMPRDFSTGSAWAKKKNHRWQIRHRPWPATAGTGGNGLSVWRLLCHKRLTHTALTRYKKNWRVFLSISRPHITTLFRHSSVLILWNVSGNYEQHFLYYAKLKLSCAWDFLLFVLCYRVRVVCTFCFKFFFVLNTRNKGSTVKTRKVEPFRVKLGK